MELNKTQNWFYLLTSLAVIILLSLGSWWLYLFFRLSHKLKDYNLEATEGNLVKMLQWEGLTFFFLLISLALALYYVFVQDHKKTRSLQAFFSSLTHELKTPLASIRLQSQVLNDLLGEHQVEGGQNQKLIKYTKRLQEDCVRLENELDKHLQLSRLERNAPLNLSSIDLISFLKNELLKFPTIKYKIEVAQESESVAIKVDDFAFSMIIRNLLENTLKHSSSREVHIKISTDARKVSIRYSDAGDFFKGNINDLGKLFYKYNSPKGAGLGLYLIRKLTKLMDGNFSIEQDKFLIFSLTFKKGKDE